MEANVKNLSIHYETFGEGMPFLLLHGYTVDHRLMTGCMEPIFQNVDGYQRIYIDLPGMGMTRSAEWIENSDDMLEIILAFLDAVIPGKRFLLAGESYGGYLARGIVHAIPRRVAGLCLLCPAIVTGHERRDLPRPCVIKRDEDLFKRLDPADAEGFAENNAVQTEETWARYNEDILCGVKLADRPFLDHFWATGYSFTADVDAFDKPYESPSLFWVGRQDTVVGYKDAWRILDNYPRATFAVLDRAGHNLQIEQSALMNPLVLEWLKRVKESLS
jgi:pimeloyl-ACP methyl ester carboxylesterase